MLPEQDLAAIRQYCEEHVPAQVAHQLRLEAVVTQGAATIVERRPPWRTEPGTEWSTGPVARFRYNATAGLWTLYCRYADMRWHRYPHVEPSTDIAALLDEVDRDPTAIFWG